MSSPRLAAAKRGSGRGDSRLTLGRNPVALVFSASLWRSAGYLLSYLLLSGVLFAIALTSIMVPLILSITVVAIPLLAGAAFVVRGCAELERVRLRQVLAGPVRGYYRTPDGSGPWRQARARWADGATWRDLAYLLGLWPVMFTLDALALGAWLVSLAGVTLPLWYSRARGVCVGYCNSPSVSGVLIGDYPHRPRMLGDHGLYVHSLSTALLVAAGFVILFLLFNYVLIATARLHATVARALLRRPADPLAPAKAVLAGPGMLGPLAGSQPAGQGGPDNRSLR